jgi:cell division protein ZipA
MESLLQTLTQDLRLALLSVGALLVVIIVVWELIQRRRAARADASHLRGPLGQERSAPVEALAQSDPLLEPVRRESQESVHDDGVAERVEPTLTLPEIHVRDRLVEPPLVDFDQAMSTKPRASSIPIMGSPSSIGSIGSTNPMMSTASTVTVDTSMSAESTSAAAPNGRTAPSMTVPKDSEPVIVALRVVARDGERFTGTALRQALQGEGFVHGDMAIFHRALADGRVLMSAASLTKPGNFDLATMDAMRYLGINLFAVLPGPVPGRDAVDKLLSVGHTISQRLKGNLLDSRGQALTEARLAEMRREAAAAGGG